MNLLRSTLLLCRVSAVVGLSSLALGGAPETAKRLVSAIDESQTFLLTDNTARQVQRGVALDLGPASAGAPMPRMSLYFSATEAQRSDLAQLLQAQQDRNSPQFHKFLTPEQYASRFGANGEDMAKVTRWLEERGFARIEWARGRAWVSFSGTAAQAEAAFDTAIHRYSMAGEIHLANNADPHLPKAFEGFIDGVHGLHNFHLRPRVRRLLPQYTQPSGGIHYLAPDDWETIYDVKPLYSAGFDGAGVSIAVVGQSDVLLSDIAAFRSAAGLPAQLPTVVIPPGQPDPGFQHDDELESDLDLEWSGAIAKRASILFITSGNGVVDAIAYAVENNVAQILSTSYGSCELDVTQSDVTTQESVFQQANAQGMTILAAAGDQGATDCDGLNEQSAIHGLAVDYPASSPYVTAIGGNEFDEGSGNYWSSGNNAANGSALSYIPETVWNDAFATATGGGFSIFGSKPSWQSGRNVPADGARDVPDVSFSASSRHDAYLICGHNWCSNGFLNSSSEVDPVGGTSTGAPSFAGVLALVIQKNGAGTTLGNINPNLYSLAQISTNIFHDITQGNNKMACQTGTSECPSGASPIGYSAGVGYDQTTGWGSVDAYHFAEQYYANIQLSSSPGVLTISPGTSATAIITVTPQNAFSGNVSFSCSVSSNLAGVTCSVPGTVNTSGTVTVTVTAASSARLLPFFRRIRPQPLLLVSVTLAILLLVSLASGRKERPFYTNASYAASAAMLAAITLGAVSCGGGGSTAVSTPATVEPALNLACSLPASGTLGVAYSGSCTASGGTVPITYSIGSGSLPAGLTINAATGAITGTPTAAGSVSFAVKASDSASTQQTATQTETVVIAPASLTLACTLQPTVTAATSYSGSCVSGGGTTPVIYSISAGGLPAGLTIDSASGAITGIATAIGTSSFTIKVSDSGSPQQTATQAETITVVPAVLTLACPVPNGSVMAAYVGKCTGGGGTTPLSYAISSGTLPAGLSINAATGAISGVPTTAGTSSLAVTVKDSGSPVQTATQTITITIAAITPLVLNGTLGAANVGQAYSAAFAASGGNTPYSYSVTAGTLPPGLTLNTVNGVLSGVPTTQGNYAFTVTASDGSSPAQTAAKPCILTVGPQVGTVTITATSGGIVKTTTISVTVP